MLCGLTTASANVGELFLVEGDATGLNTARNVLDLILALNLAAPHSFDVTGLVFCNFINGFFHSRQRTANSSI